MKAFPQELRDAAAELNKAKANYNMALGLTNSVEATIAIEMARLILAEAGVAFDAEMKKYMEAQRG